MKITFETWSQTVNVVKDDWTQEENVKPPAVSLDNRGWLEYWSTELLTALTAATDPNNPHRALDLQHAVRCAHSTHSRAMKVKPALKMPRGY